MSAGVSIRQVPRWLIAAPGPQETFRSILERVYECYGLVDPRWAFSFDPHLAHAAAPPIDAMGIQGIRRMAHHLKMPASSLYEHRISDGPYLLAEPFRRVFCPACWKESDSKALPRTFRAPLQSLFAITCDRHPSIFLREAARSGPNLGRQRIHLRMFEDDEAPEIQELTAWLVPCAQRLEAALRGRIGWPTDWRGSTHECRVLMIALCLRLVPDAGTCFLDHFRQALGDYSIGVPVSTIRLRDPWDAVRMMPSPSARRALLWAVLWYFAMPTNDSFWPVWLCNGGRGSRTPAPGTLARDDPRHYTSLDALIRQCVLQSNPARQRQRKLNPRRNTESAGLSQIEERLQKRFNIHRL